jgi:hypothetical protein
VTASTSTHQASSSCHSSRQTHRHRHTEGDPKARSGRRHTVASRIGLASLSVRGLLDTRLS